MHSADRRFPSESSSILQTGRNCWRIEPATRLSVLVDAETYFARLEEALRKARRSILIVGWDFDGNLELQRSTEAKSQRLGTLLRSLVEANPDLKVRILVWSVAVMHGPGSTSDLLVGDKWMEHARIDLRLDTKLPIYAAHHQKVISIDGSCAFCGGIDLTVERWDTCAHVPDDSRRRRPDGGEYGPVHDVQALIEGRAAEALGDLARERWRTATGEEIAPPSGGSTVWPEGLKADFRDQNVAIARTAPAWGKRAPVHEVMQLTCDALKAARDLIYIEAQYLSSRMVGDLLEQSLEREDGPAVVIVTSLDMHGLIERFAMGSNRDRMIRRLTKTDRFDRLRIFHPVVDRGGSNTEILVHAKVLVVDDMLLKIGSANLNNRSWGLDTECDLTVEATNAETAAGIASQRTRLVSEHLGVEPKAFLEATGREGSFLRAIDALNVQPRGLERFPAEHERGPTRRLPGTWLIDPVKPFEPLWFLGRKNGSRRGS